VDLCYARLGKQPCGLPGSAGEENVVRIEEDDGVSRAGGEACVDGGALAGVALHKCHEASGVALDDAGGVVCGAVIDHDDLDLGVHLVERGFDGLRQETLYRRNS
jgi:hypothetical protein